MRVLNHGLLDSLKSAKSLPVTQQTSEFLLSIIKLCHISFDLGSAIVPGEFQAILDELYQLSENRDILGDARRALEDAIAAICSVRTVIHPSQSDIDISVSPTKALREVEVCSNSLDDTSRGQFLLTTEMLSNRSGKGAGAFLDSRLCLQGWRFPVSVLTEADEKFLFDVEVKIRMGNGHDVRLLYDILADFPADVLVSRKVWFTATYQN